jgi:hypothetical protein
MTGRLLGTRLAILALVLLIATACAGRSSPSTGDAPTGAVAAFAGAFDAGVGHRRLVLLLSPT